jgi:glycosyltransferase involved in cell wall biosynthesis
VVLTSLSEAQPRVLLEAMAAGIPVVATDVGGCGELVGRDAGVLTPTGDAAATASALVRLGRDRLLRESLGSAGRRRVGVDHAPDRIYAAWRGLYGRWLEARRTPGNPTAAG